MGIQSTKRIVVSLALAAVALVALILMLSAQFVRAQPSGEIYVDKQLGRANPVVHVGEYLTFTVLIRNDTVFTVTTLPLSDTYNTAVLGFVDAVPPPDTVDEEAGRIDWGDLTTSFGDLAPGQAIVLVVGFVAEHPQTAVVNAAEVHDVLGGAGALSGTQSIISDLESVGGSSPVDKEMLAGLVPQAGLPLTFTILITNDGFTTITVVPLVDTYNPAWLTFSYAVPPPDQVDVVNGVLTWLDITTWTGDIPAHGTVSVTTVFTALAAVDNTTNSAEVSGASDWYGNDMAGGADSVPITIIGAPSTPTATPVPTASPTPVPATKKPGGPAPTPTPVATPIPASIPLLPKTGGRVLGAETHWPGRALCPGPKHRAGAGGLLSWKAVPAPSVHGGAGPAKHGPWSGNWNWVATRSVLVSLFLMVLGTGACILYCSRRTGRKRPRD